eukprot:1796295-Amphidinium_carterae.1
MPHPLCTVVTCASIYISQLTTRHREIQHSPPLRILSTSLYLSFSPMDTTTLDYSRIHHHGQTTTLWEIAEQSVANPAFSACFALTGAGTSHPALPRVTHLRMSNICQAYIRIMRASSA